MMYDREWRYTELFFEKKCVCLVLGMAGGLNPSSTEGGQFGAHLGMRFPKV